MASNTEELFNVGAAKSADAEVGKTMLAAIKRKVSSNQRSDRELRVAAAYAMHVHFRLAREAGETVKIADLGRNLGGSGTPVAGSTINLWKRLGAAVVDLGIEPNTDEWTALADVANRVPVSWALDGFDFDTIRVDANGKPTIKTDSYVGVTRETFDKALSYLYPDGLRDEENNKMHKARTSAEANKAIVGDYGTDADRAEVETAASEERMKRVADAARYLADNLAKISTEEFVKVRDNLQTAMQAARKHADAVKKAEADSAAA